MTCVNGTFWTNLPVGSKFVINASGDETLFNAAVGVNVNGTPEAVWKHKEIVAGKKRTLAANENCTFHVLVNIFHEPTAGAPVVLNAHIEQVNGDPDPVRTCSSSFVHAGHFPITFTMTD